MSLTSSELDALNVTQHWFGGRINSVDLFVASIEKSTVLDLQDEGYLRKRWLGWEISKKGRKALAEAGITSFWDTWG